MMPRRLRIGPKVSYKVDVVERSEIGGLYGIAHAEPNILKIGKEQGKKEMASTLLHEAIHALDWEWEIGLSEDKTHKLEQALYFFLTKNSDALRKSGL